ncbi:MAG: radical SAM-associated putative lipoprotein [Bacteroidales bacterium]|nr:radical SAM-associated putative lipoprotein [Bacteroidales bacterium]
MKIRFLKLQNWLLVSLLSLLGFSGCRSTQEMKSNEPPADPQLADLPPMEPRPSQRNEIVLMYGVPTANYQIKGKVFDAKNAPVQGIQVLRLERGMNATPDSIVGDAAAVKQYTSENAVMTAADGTFVISFTDRPFDELRLLVRDVDGAANGNYRNQICTLIVKPENFEGGAGWNSGTATLHVNIPMEERR